MSRQDLLDLVGLPEYVELGLLVVGRGELLLHAARPAEAPHAFQARLPHHFPLHIHI